LGDATEKRRLLRFQRLNVANAPADLVILRIASCIPESTRIIVVEGNKGSYATSTTAAQVVLPSARQLQPNALPAAFVSHDQSVHIAPPPIPRGDQGPNDLSVTFGY
jgi:hypothetical protein